MEHKSNMCLILCGEIYMLNLDDALLFEADDHYTEIHNLYGNKIMVPFCLGEIEREIRTRFPDHNNLVRMGRKYIINKNRVFHMYGAQNEAYKCLLVENVANDLCFS